MKESKNFNDPDSFWNNKSGFCNVVHLDELICKDCAKRYDSSIIYCDGFDGHKPASILGGGQCPNYEKETPTHK